MQIKSTSSEVKGILDVIIDRFKDIMTLKPFQQKVDLFLSKEYTQGLIKSEAELRPPINFVPNSNSMSFLNKYVMDNLQAHSDEIGNQLRQEIQRGLMNKEGVEELKQRIKVIFNDKTYTDRMKTVMRTEKIRANNAGSFDGALQAQEAGVNIKKYLDVILDSRTSDCCRVGNAKYGTPSEAIPLDEEFVMKIKNKTCRGLYPPFLPNCRSTLRYVVEE